MSTLLTKTLFACGLALAAATAWSAVPAPPTDGAAPAKARVKKAAPKPKAAKPVAASSIDEPEPDVSDTTVTEYSCELGNKVTTYHHDKDESQLALRWKKRLHRLTRVGTTTGARRFENALFGLVWIGIPAKGMLLDSKQNRQLANECKNAEQMKSAVVEAVETPTN